MILYILINSKLIVYIFPIFTNINKADQECSPYFIA